MVDINRIPGQGFMCSLTTGLRADAMPDSARRGSCAAGPPRGAVQALELWRPPALPPRLKTDAHAPRDRRCRRCRYRREVCGLVVPVLALQGGCHVSPSDAVGRGRECRARVTDTSDVVRTSARTAERDLVVSPVDVRRMPHEKRSETQRTTCATITAAGHSTNAVRP